MYALVGGLLSFLIVAALVLSLFGSLAFSPFALLASVIVFCTVGVGTSLALSKLYGVYSHLRSALITSLILTLLFTPTLEVLILLQFGLISVIAQASKFVVVHKGRHIFNPAAFGALAGGLLGLQFASWWVGTPVLFPIILTGALLLLFKTHLLEAGLAFIVVSLLILARLGVDPWTALSSWPLLFLAGFMLSEPSTLPPRHNQRTVIAVIVAILVSIPFQIGWFHSSPEFALIAGNLVAFGLGYKQRADLGLRFKSRRSLTPTVDEIVFSTKRAPHFEPGQYLELSVPHSKQDPRGTRRYFSITSVPGEHQVTLGTRFYDPSSSFKKQLRALESGASVASTGIVGDFVLPKKPSDKLLFIAGGIGITPFISMLRAGLNGRDVTLLYFVREPAETAYHDVIEKSGITVHYFAPDSNVAPFKNAAMLTEELLKTHVQDLGERVAYVSGPPAMVASAKTLLRGARSVKTDYFSGY